MSLLQDSHEFACKLLEWLHEDTNRVQRPSKMPEIDNTTIPEAEVLFVGEEVLLTRAERGII